MQFIETFSDFETAVQTLDNGGRFYNFMTDANDGEISAAELAKAAGVFSDQQKMKIFLEMSMMHFAAAEKQRIYDMMPNKLQAKLAEQSLDQYNVHEAVEYGYTGQSVVVSGIPKWSLNKSDFMGFIMVPIMAGSVTTFTMIPIIDNYDVYELRDEESDQTFIVAHAKGKGKLPNKVIQCGGILKELKSDKNKEVADKLFLEIVYCIDQ